MSNPENKEVPIVISFYRTKQKRLKLWTFDLLYYCVADPFSSPQCLLFLHHFTPKLTKNLIWLAVFYLLCKTMMEKVVQLYYSYFESSFYLFQSGKPPFSFKALLKMTFYPRLQVCIIMLVENFHFLQTAKKRWKRCYFCILYNIILMALYLSLDNVAENI